MPARHCGSRSVHERKARADRQFGLGRCLHREKARLRSAGMTQAEQTPRNPDFDDDLVVWDDRYSGRYQPVAYDRQFDDQWRLFLEGKVGFHDHTGVETTTPYIDDRIFELTGVRGVL